MEKNYCVMCDCCNEEMFYLIDNESNEEAEIVCESCADVVIEQCWKSDLVKELIE